MKAARYHGNKDMRIEDVPEPSKPSAGEVILKVRRAAICGTDVTEYLHGPHFASVGKPHPISGQETPVITGHEFVGEIIELGSEVEGLAVGQRVVPGAGSWCGECKWCQQGKVNLCVNYFVYGLNADGGMAEFAKMPAYMCEVVPEACSDNAAAMAQPVSVALHAVDRSRAKPDTPLVIMGIGGIGSFIVAAAHLQGFGPIIAVDINEQRLEMAKNLGAAHVINGRSQDTVKMIMELTDGMGVETFIEATGSPIGPQTALDVTQKGGDILLVGLQADPVPIDLHRMTFREVTMTTTVSHVCGNDLPKSLDILTNTDLAELTMDRVVPIDALVQDGIMALADGRAKGKIVVDPNA